MRTTSLALLLLCASSASFAQDGLWTRWLDMASRSEAEQPQWITPLVTTTARLKQEFRYDVERQTHTDGITTDNFGVSKGLQFVPERNVEVQLGVPPFIVNNPASKDGFGDWQFRVKYRIAAADKQHGNYILTAFYQMSLPTGQYQQGALSAIATPTLAYGKGFGNFAAQGTLGASLPTSHTRTTGRSVVWNNAFEYRIAKNFWPELEANLTYYDQGRYSGRTSVYLTPGLLIGRFRIKGRLAFSFGAGFETAATSFHPTNHMPVFSIRFPLPPPGT